MGFSFISLDIETTGISIENEIIEVGAVEFRNGKPERFFSSLINPKIPIPPNIISLTGIKNEDVENAPCFDEIKEELAIFIGDLPVVGHNITSFDLPFLKKKGLEIYNPVLDTLPLSSKILPQLKRRKLDDVAKALGVEIGIRHRALPDAILSGKVLVGLIEKLSSLEEEEKEKVIEIFPNIVLLGVEI